MSQSDAWMPFYVGDYLASTGHLTTFEHGAYLLLLMHLWRNGILPNDDEQLMTIAKANESVWLSSGPKLRAFLTETNGGLTQKRLEAERKKVLQIKKLRAISGQKGGLARAKAKSKQNPSNHNHKEEESSTRELSSSEVSPRDADAPPRSELGLSASSPRSSQECEVEGYSPLYPDWVRKNLIPAKEADADRTGNSDDGQTEGKTIHSETPGIGVCLVASGENMGNSSGGRGNIPDGVNANLNGPGGKPLAESGPEYPDAKNPGGLGQAAGGGLRDAKSWADLEDERAKANALRQIKELGDTQ